MRRGIGLSGDVRSVGAVTGCLGLLLGCLLFVGCAEKVDPSRPFEMAMNGFDVLEPQVGGRIRGTLLHATLYGSFENAQTAEVTEPKKPRKLELWNFPFDVELAQSPY